MSSDRINLIRKEEKLYHDYCYDNFKLFEQGSWLYRPVKAVLDLMSYFEDKDVVKVLDLGCGVGRNSIPIAQKLKVGSEVVCVDLLDTAVEKLRQYSKEFDVEQFIVPHKADIADFVIHSNEYDYIVAVSSLEHVDSNGTLEKVLLNMRNGTKPNGLNCIILNSEVEEFDLETGAKMAALMEVNISTEEMLDTLRRIYTGWEEVLVLPKRLEYQITRQDKPVLLKTTAITFAVRNT
ncbi:class I SAM-dependent methyltransferase [Cytobacillus oceanisediminis]|uniref:Methyltransferase n=1 Tax=Cytobacillus oceanisediminis 2691 TaxID=1196031 RepID=A0A160MFQ0_9BACI|nr:class I SAM-dependent methyltransferase [Cytobacillus oceanisediminis]AND41428.1 methyltransferase [Cytobacillus oceanisediminis 2691]